MANRYSPEALIIPHAVVQLRRRQRQGCLFMGVNAATVASVANQLWEVADIVAGFRRGPEGRLDRL